ncbi:hypothetical protein GTP44_08445 [Duganella sp. FT50W]|uniref:Uncharacterized protein n=1 Tax=Duganella lactea TaxID=2692173 RepID=A0A6L8MQ30_9BURK|nr:hypothetical protein [Duganella lactea]MYM81988.1 hypothetical protein [Duganella lactea]
MSNDGRLDAEWVALNAFRELAKIATKGDMAKATYDNAFDLGGELYPELLGPESSILKRARESDLAKEYRQRAAVESMKQPEKKEKVSAAELLDSEIEVLSGLLAIAKKEKVGNRTKVDQLKRKLASFQHARQEVGAQAHTENQLIFRDAYNLARTVPPFASGKAHRDFRLPDANVLRVRVLHPDKPEHVTGADIIYERHSPSEDKASVVAIQYKIWEKKKLSLGDERMKKQLARLATFTCANGICKYAEGDNEYRFPCCAAFLRPTDKLQNTDQSFLSSGEHLPICQIPKFKSGNGDGTLEYKKIKDVSLSAEMFEQLFNKGKIGSRLLTYDELREIYQKHKVVSSEDSVIIYAQEFESLYDSSDESDE